MFSKELELLIEAAVSDGQVTDKEIEILGRRAEAEGVDMDELLMYVEGRLRQQKAGGELERNSLICRLFDYLEKSKQMNVEERQARREQRATMFKLRMEKREQKHPHSQESAAFDAEHPEVFESKVKALTEVGSMASNIISGIAGFATGPEAGVAKGLFDVFKKK